MLLISVLILLSPLLSTGFTRIGVYAGNKNAPPYFDKALYEAEVDENEDLHHTIVTVAVKENQNSSDVRYEITSGNIGGAFAVDPRTGAIYIAGSLDYKSRKRYDLRLTAINNKKENYTTVVIRIKDIDDYPLAFERSSYRTPTTEEDIDIRRNIAFPEVGKLNWTEGVLNSGNVQAVVQSGDLYITQG